MDFFWTQSNPILYVIHQRQTVAEFSCSEAPREKLFTIFCLHWGQTLPCVCVSAAMWFRNTSFMAAEYLSAAECFQYLVGNRISHKPRHAHNKDAVCLLLWAFKGHFFPHHFFFSRKPLSLKPSPTCAEGDRRVTMHLKSAKNKKCKTLQTSKAPLLFGKTHEQGINSGQTH